MKGRRLHGYAPHGHWRTMTFVAALRCDRIVGPCVFDGPINGQSFRAWVDQQLLETIGPGDIVIMDNLGSHKSIEIGRAIRARGARLWYLPAYSPDLNPIEQAFSKIKHWMRMAQRRSQEDTWPHRTSRPHVLTRRMRKLPHKRRVCLTSNVKCSSSLA